MRNRLSQHKQNKLIELFIAGITTRTSTELLDVNKTTEAIFSFSSFAITYLSKQPILEMFGGIDADEKLFC